MDTNQASTDLNEASYPPYNFEQDDYFRDFPLDALSNPFATTSFEAWGAEEQLNHPLPTISSNPASHLTSTCVHQIPDRPVAVELQPLLTEISILRAKVETIENDLKKSVQVFVEVITMLI